MKMSIKKSLLGIAISALSFNALADFNDNKRSVLNLTGNHTYLSDVILERYNTHSFSGVMSNEEVNEIANEIRNTDFVYLDMNEVKDRHLISEYITEAVKQNKLIVIENMNNQVIDGLFMSFDAEVVIIEPKKGEPDIVTTFGGGDTPIEYEEVTQSSTSNELTTVSHGHKLASYPVADSYHDMIDYQREHALTQVTDAIDASFMPKIAALTISSGVTGAESGYPCSAEAQEAKLCYTVTNRMNRYTSPDDGRKSIFTAVRGYSVGAYRNTQTDHMDVFIAPYGHVTPTMENNSRSRRGYYLDSVTSAVEVSNAAGLQLTSWIPQNANNSTTVSTSRGMSLSTDISYDTSGKIGGKTSIGYSESNSESMSLPDWKVVSSNPAGQGENLTWEYSLSKFSNDNAWVSHSAFELPQLANVPDISRYGLQYSSEAFWSGRLAQVSGQFSFSVVTDVTLEERRLTDRDIFGSYKWSTLWESQVLPKANYSINLNNLKE